MEKDKLYDAAIKSRDVLFSANTVFPLILFPDTVTLDREQLTIIHRPFFRMAKTTAIRIKDILNAEVDVGPFFGSLRVSSRYFAGSDNQFAGTDNSENAKKPPTINFLWRDDATKLHSMLQGYIIATQKGIDCAEISKEELMVLLRELGQTEATST